MSLVVDSHVLLGSGGPWWEQLNPGIDDVTPVPARKVTFELSRVLDDCARCGIDRACVVSPVNATYEAANRQIAAAIEQHPDKLIGIAAHSPQREEGRLKRLLTTEVRSMGFKAVRSDGHPTRELLDVAQGLDIPIIYAPLLLPLQGPARMFYVMVESYPDVNFIVPHMCGRYSPEYTASIEMVDYIAAHDNVYFDTSAIMYLKYLERAVRMVPIDRVLFASYGPHLDPAVAVETIRILELSQEKHAKVMGENALSLLKV